MATHVLKIKGRPTLVLGETPRSLTKRFGRLVDDGCKLIFKEGGAKRFNSANLAQRYVNRHQIILCRLDWTPLVSE